MVTLPVGTKVFITFHVHPPHVIDCVNVSGCDRLAELTFVNWFDIVSADELCGGHHSGGVRGETKEDNLLQQSFSRHDWVTFISFLIQLEVRWTQYWRWCYWTAAAPGQARRKVGIFGLKAPVFNRGPSFPDRMYF